MANYEKKTPAIFKKDLAANKYDTVTAARRAVGRMSEWTDSDKNTARSWIDKHFGAPSANPKAAKTPKAPKADKPKAPVKKAAKAPAKAKKQAAAKKEPKAKTTKPRAKRTPPAEATSDAERIHNANAKVSTLHAVLTTMKEAKELGASESDVAIGARRAQAALIQVVDEVMQMTGGPHVDPAEEQKVAILKGAAPKGNSAGQAQPILPG